MYGPALDFLGRRHGVLPAAYQPGRMPYGNIAMIASM
jgi:hypothetical protein